MLIFFVLQSIQSGTIPSSFGNLSALSYLYLYSNALTGNYLVVEFINTINNIVVIISGVIAVGYFPHNYILYSPSRHRSGIFWVIFNNDSLDVTTEFFKRYSTADMVSLVDISFLSLF